MLPLLELIAFASFLALLLLVLFVVQRRGKNEESIDVLEPRVRLSVFIHFCNAFWGWDAAKKLGPRIRENLGQELGEFYERLYNYAGNGDAVPLEQFTETFVRRLAEVILDSSFGNLTRKRFFEEHDAIETVLSHWWRKVGPGTELPEPVLIGIKNACK